MLNIAEYERLERMGLSFRAKYLYGFILRRNALENRHAIDMGQLCQSMVCRSGTEQFNPLPEDINAMLHELHRCGLIRAEGYEEGMDFSGRAIELPLMEEGGGMPSLPFAMDSTWQPSGGFATCALSCGLDDCSYSTEDLRGFISYWKGKPEKRSQSAWERAFAMRLLKTRSAQAPRARAQRMPGGAQQPTGRAEKPKY